MLGFWCIWGGVVLEVYLGGGDIFYICVSSSLGVSLVVGHLEGAAVDFGGIYDWV